MKKSEEQEVAVDASIHFSHAQNDKTIFNFEKFIKNTKWRNMHRMWKRFLAKRNLKKTPFGKTCKECYKYQKKSDKDQMSKNDFT